MFLILGFGNIRILVPLKPDEAGNLVTLAMLLGKSNRELIDEANQEPDIPQILFLMNGLGIPDDALIYHKLSNATNHREKMELIWKAILGRLPKDSEEPLFENTPEDLMWALLNSNEFTFVK
jgi:hypothetical protein